jgi:hypothetical protein
VVLIDGQELADVVQLSYATDTVTFDQVAEAADHILTSLLVTTDAAGATIDHGNHSWCREGAVAIATEMWQARTATGGQPVGLDFQPGPYRLSAWMTRRVQSVVGSCWAVRGMVG